jgi:hypothetical protein
MTDKKPRRKLSVSAWFSAIGLVLTSLAVALSALFGS